MAGASPELVEHVAARIEYDIAAQKVAQASLEYGSANALLEAARARLEAAQAAHEAALLAEVATEMGVG